MTKILGGILVMMGVWIFCATPVFATDSRAPEVQVYRLSDAARTRAFRALDGRFSGGMSVASGDVNGDGKDEIVVAAQNGGGPQVVIYREDGSVIRHFFAYDQGMRRGVNVAVGDLDGNGVDEIVTATSHGVVHVRIFNGEGHEVNRAGGFFPYGVNFNGGASVTTADLNGDGKKEIVTGSLRGSSGHVRGFTSNGTYAGFDLFPFSSDYSGGVTVAGANVDGGVEDEIIVGVNASGQSLVKVYKTDGTKKVLGSFRAFGEGFLNGVEVTGADVDRDGADEVLVAAHGGGGAHVQFFEASGAEIGRDIHAFENDFRGGLKIAAGDSAGDGVDKIFVVPTRIHTEVVNVEEDIEKRGGENVVSAVPETGKFIEVDLSEQRLRAFENGKEIISFLISSGTKKYPTPKGIFKVSARIFIKDYIWYFSPSDNYNIPDVKNNLRFAPNLYIHGAPWRRNFGIPQSHGCVTAEPLNAEKVYNWTPIGTPVLIHS